MKFTPILAAIESILSAAASTKDAIKLYRKYDISEQGIRDVPFCILGAALDANLEEAYLPNLHMYQCPLIIQLLGRSYDISDRHNVMAETLDTLQHNVYTVLNGNRKLNDTVLTSLVTRIQYIRTGEYFGFALTLRVKTKL